jgi:AcrR family transcriptional regulator
LSTKPAVQASGRAEDGLPRQRCAAVALADEKGVASLTMRRLAEQLGVEAMSLYHHVANKEAILDGMVDAVFSEIDLPSKDLDWRTAMRRRAFSSASATAARRTACRVNGARPLA